jgi:addiction module HigA family antidote
MIPRRIKPIHPGEILLKDFLEPFEMSRNALAKAIGVPAPRVNDVVLGRRGFTADTALRLAAFIGTTPEFWLNLQSSYDLKVARQRKELVRNLEAIRPHGTAAGRARAPA